MNLSIEFISFSGFVICSMFIESVFWSINSSLGLGFKWIESLPSIKGFFIVSFNSNLSIFWIIFSGLVFFSINNLSMFCIFKGSFIFGDMNMLSDLFMLFFGFGFLNIVINSVFCISFFLGSKESINTESICWYNKSSFSFFNIVIPSNPSIIIFLKLWI